MLIRLWNFFSGLGAYQDISFQLQQRVKLSNQISLIVGVVAFSFIIVNILVYSYTTATAMLILLMICIAIPVLNYGGFTGLSRLILSIAPPLGTLALNLSIKINHPEKIGLIHYITPRMIMIAFIAIPLILFTSGEIVLLVLALLTVLALGTIVYGYAHDYFKVSYTDLGIDALYYDQIIFEDIILLLLILVVGLLFFRYLNFQYDARTAKLLYEAQEKNKKLNEREVHLERTLEEVRKSREEDKKRNWEAKGLARFANLLRSKADETRLYNILLSGIVKYVNATQGGLYLLNQEKLSSEDIKEVTMVACYAYSRKKIEEKSFQSHEGVIGQCLATRKVITLENIPNDYLKISTGLGYTKPRFLIVLPISFHENIQGVIELAFIKKLEAYKIKFLEKLSENIGAIIIGNRVNEDSSLVHRDYQNAINELKNKEQEIIDLKQKLENLQDNPENQEPALAKQETDLNGKEELQNLS